MQQNIQYNSNNNLIMENTDRTSVFALQNKLIKLWQQKTIDETYKQAYLQFLDSLEEDQCRNQIILEYKRTLNNNSFFHRIKQSFDSRKNIMENLITNYLGDMDRSEQMMQFACLEIKKLREQNYKLCNNILKMMKYFDSIKSTTPKKLRQQGYIKMFKIIDDDNNIIRSSYLKQFIEFGKNYDPFFIVPYQYLQTNKTINTQQTPSCIYTAFSINISHAYKLMRTKNQILNYLTNTQNSDQLIEGNYQEQYTSGQIQMVPYSSNSINNSKLENKNKKLDKIQESEDQLEQQQTKRNQSLNKNNTKNMIRIKKTKANTNQINHSYDPKLEVAKKNCPIDFSIPKRNQSLHLDDIKASDKKKKLLFPSLHSNSLIHSEGNTTNSKITIKRSLQSKPRNSLQSQQDLLQMQAYRRKIQIKSTKLSADDNPRDKIEGIIQQLTPKGQYKRNTVNIHSLKRRVKPMSIKNDDIGSSSQSQEDSQFRSSPFNLRKFNNPNTTKKNNTNKGDTSSYRQDNYSHNSSNNSKIKLLPLSSLQPPHNTQKTEQSQKNNRHRTLNQNKYRENNIRSLRKYMTPLSNIQQHKRKQQQKRQHLQGQQQRIQKQQQTQQIQNRGRKQSKRRQSVYQKQQTQSEYQKQIKAKQFNKQIQQQLQQLREEQQQRLYMEQLYQLLEDQKQKLQNNAINQQSQLDSQQQQIQREKQRESHKRIIQLQEEISYRKLLHQQKQETESLMQIEKDKEVNRLERELQQNIQQTKLGKRRISTDKGMIQLQREQKQQERYNNRGRKQSSGGNYGILKQQGRQLERDVSIIRGKQQIGGDKYLQNTENGQNKIKQRPRRITIRNNQNPKITIQKDTMQDNQKGQKKDKNHKRDQKQLDVINKQSRNNKQEQNTRKRNSSKYNIDEKNQDSKYIKQGNKNYEHQSQAKYSVNGNQQRQKGLKSLRKQSDMSDKAKETNILQTKQQKTYNPINKQQMGKLQQQQKKNPIENIQKAQLSKQQQKQVPSQQEKNKLVDNTQEKNKNLQNNTSQKQPIQSDNNNNNNKKIKKQLQMRPCELTLKKLEQILADSQILPKYKQYFRHNQVKRIINNCHCYLNQFYENQGDKSKLVAFGICTPEYISEDYTIIFWGVLQGIINQRYQQFIFKKYLDYLEKYTVLSHIFLQKNIQMNQWFRDFGFTQTPHGLRRKRSNFLRKKRLPQFMSIQCSNICSKQQKCEQKIFYSEEIQTFTQQNSFANEGILRCQKLKNVKSVKKFKIKEQAIPIQMINAQLAKYNIDTYQYDQKNELPNFSFCYLKEQFALDNNFYAQNGYFATEGRYLQIQQGLIMKTKSHHDQYEIYFGKKCKSLKTFVRLCKEGKFSSQKKYFGFKMFSKQLYGKILCPEVEKSYGNWLFNFIWQDQLKGLVKKPLPSKQFIFGLETFQISIYHKDELLYAFQVEQNDVLF